MQQQGTGTFTWGSGKALWPVTSEGPTEHFFLDRGAEQGVMFGQNPTQHPIQKLSDPFRSRESQGRAPEGVGKRGGQTC